MLKVSPDQIFTGTIVVVAPHMDDEALACGGLIASLSQKERIHIIYATDGMKSPSPIIQHLDVISPDLGEVRVKESIAAMTFLGVSEENLHFLRLPEGQLRNYKPTLCVLLFELIKAINPNYIFIPFRYDRHPDHLVINHVIMEGQVNGIHQAQVIEYFVYYRWKLLPQKDIRAYIKPECLIEIDISDVSKKKRMALNRFKSQTTLYYSWQTRPILTPKLLDEESNHPEYFLISNTMLPGESVFTKSILWIRFVHRLEPLLKNWRYLAGAYLNRVLRKYANNTT